MVMVNSTYPKRFGSLPVRCYPKAFGMSAFEAANGSTFMDDVAFFPEFAVNFKNT